MENRSLKELYQLLLDNFDKTGFNYGICDKIGLLQNKYIITWLEYSFLIFDFNSRKPTIFNKFWWNKSYKGDAYWWDLNEEGNKQRKLFIQSIIDKL